MSRKQRGYEAERLVVDDYIARGYSILEQNWTMRWGEVDVIALDRESKEIIFVEVKVITGMVSDTLGYVTPSKLRHLRKSISWYMMKHQTMYADYDVRVDVVFVHDNSIHDRYESVHI